MNHQKHRVELLKHGEAISPKSPVLSDLTSVGHCVLAMTRVVAATVAATVICNLPQGGDFGEIASLCF
ncbi:MAG: hypothetical protein NC453_18135 [Muribaculum sp.]|nr:hypothetical protein [Muribaculum sp.]